MVGRLKPPLDFYYAYKTWIARIYPPHITQPGTEKQKKTWCVMKDAVDAWNALTHLDREAWTKVVRNAMKTGKDFFYSCRLKGATDDRYNWWWLNVHYVGFSRNKFVLATTKKPGSNWRAYWCTGEENQKTYYWKDEGFCIRGRRMAVKRHIIEQWDKYVNQGGLCILPYKCYWIDVGPDVNEVHVTFRRYGLQTIGTHGRTGVYVIRR